MVRDRVVLWMIIAALALLTVAQVIGQGVVSHARAVDEKYSHPNPKFEQFGADHHP